MKAIDRLKQYIDYKGFNNRNFELEIGLSNGYLGTQLKRNADLGESILMKIIDNCLDINPEWLLTGKGSMLKEENNSSQIPHKEEEEQNTIHLLQDHITTLKENNSLLKDKIIHLERELNLCKKSTNLAKKEQ